MELDSYLRFASGHRIFDLEAGGQRPDGHALVVVHQIVERLAAEITDDADRLLATILADVATRLEEPAAQPVAALVHLLATNPQGEISWNHLTGNLAFQALTWLIRTKPKIDHHYHISGNADPIDWGLSERFPSFDAQRDTVDASLTSPPKFLRCVTGVVRGAFADGCSHVELRFNPFSKPYHSDLPGLLRQLHEALCYLEESAARSLGRRHAVRWGFSINRRYGAAFADRALRQLEELLAATSAPPSLKQRIAGWDLAGTESKVLAPDAWREPFSRARDLGLSTIVHLGDSTNSTFESLTAHLDYVEQTLDAIGPIERIGHAMVLAPFVEYPDGSLIDASIHESRVSRLLRRLQADNVAIETAPAPSVLRSPLHRVFYWLGFPGGLSVIPVADEVFQYKTTLSQWLATLLLLAPDDGPTWKWVEQIRPDDDFLRSL
jgi:adenosine deaminase